MTHRQLTKTLVVGALWGTLAACAQNAGPFFVSAITLPGPGCTATTTATTESIGVGRLNVTSGGANVLPMQVSVIGYADIVRTNTETTSGLLDTQAKIFYIDQISYAYDSSPSPKLPNLAPEVRPVLFPVTGDITVIMPMIGGGAALKLPTALPNAGDTKRLLVSLELRGREAGSGARFSTGKVTYPIELYRTPDCLGATVPLANGAGCLDTCYLPDGKPLCYDPLVGAPSSDAGCQ